MTCHVYDLYQRNAVNLDGDQKDKRRSLLTDYPDVFSAGPQDLGRTSLVKHKTDTSEAKPIRQRPRRLPFLQMEEASRTLLMT